MELNGAVIIDETSVDYVKLFKEKRHSVDMEFIQ